MKTRVSKVFGSHAGFMSFVLGVTLLTSLTIAEASCPVSNGTGVLPGARGLEIVAIEVELVDHMILNLECGWDFERFTYDVKILVVNDTATTIRGAIVVNFHNPAYATAEGFIDEEGVIIKEKAYAGLTEAAIPVFVEVAAGTAQTIEETFIFDGLMLGGGDTGMSSFSKHTVTITTTGEFVCPYDGGTGKVSIPEWLRLI